jgi:hypothetical protein
MNDILKIIAFIKVYNPMIFGVHNFNVDHGKDNLESYFVDKLGWSGYRLHKTIKLLRDEGIITKQKADVPNLYSLSLLHKMTLKSMFKIN